MFLARHLAGIVIPAFLFAELANAQQRLPPLGELVQIDLAKRKMQIRYADRTRIVSIPKDVKFFYDEHPDPDLEKLQPGMRVRVEIDEKYGMAKSIRADSAEPEKPAPLPRKPLEAPKVLSARLAKDEVGTLPPAVHVFQILGPNSMLVDLGGRNVVRIDGVSTDGLADKDFVRSTLVFKIVGNHTYTTITGASNTVMRFEPEPETSRKEREARNQKIQEENAKIDAQNAARLADHTAQLKAIREHRAKGRAMQEGEANKTVDAAKESRAAASLNGAKRFIDQGDASKAKQRLNELLERYPGTAAAKEAQELLKKLDQ